MPFTRARPHVDSARRAGDDVCSSQDGPTTPTPTPSSTEEPQPARAAAFVSDAHTDPPLVSVASRTRPGEAVEGRAGRTPCGKRGAAVAHETTEAGGAAPAAAAAEWSEDMQARAHACMQVVWSPFDGIPHKRRLWLQQLQAEQEILFGGDVTAADDEKSAFLWGVDIDFFGYLMDRMGR